MSNEWNRKSAHYRQTLPRFGYTIFSHMCVNDWILFVRFASSLPRTPIRLLHCSHTGSVYFDTVHTHLTNLTCSSLARQIIKWSETCTHTDTTLLLKHMFIIFVFVYIWLIEMFKNIHTCTHTHTQLYMLAMGQRRSMCELNRMIDTFVTSTMAISTEIDPVFWAIKNRAQRHARWSFFPVLLLLYAADVLCVGFFR